ncbi:histidine phosphatase family protein [Priestia megaterium]|nr:histidine phosphatase family protein [Priestia megaterium]
MDYDLVVTLVRHGLTLENTHKKYIGWSNPSLSFEGKKRLRPYNKQPDIVIGSDLLRAVETTAILFPACSYIPMASWRELHFGDWEEKTYEELKAVKEYRQWIENPFEKRPPNGESFSDFSERIWHAWDATIEYAIKEKSKHIGVVTHGGPLRLIASYFSQSNSFWDTSFIYGEGFSMKFTYEQAKERGACISYSAVRLMESENG